MNDFQLIWTFWILYFETLETLFKSCILEGLLWQHASGERSHCLITARLGESVGSPLGFSWHLGRGGGIRILHDHLVGVEVQILCRPTLASLSWEDEVYLNSSLHLASIEIVRWRLSTAGKLPSYHQLGWTSRLPMWPPMTPWRRDLVIAQWRLKSQVPIHSKTTLIRVLNTLLSLVRLEEKLPLSLANRAVGRVDIFSHFFHTLCWSRVVPCLTKPPFFWFLAENSFGGDHWCFWYSSFFIS